MRIISSHSASQRLTSYVAFAVILTMSYCSEALTILSGPTFTRAARAPLAGVLALTTDDYSRISVSVTDGQETWERSFYDYQMAHAIPLLGFKPSRTNTITVTAHDALGNRVTALEPLTFVTGPLPSDFPKMKLLVSKPDKMEPGYTLFRAANNNTARGYLTIVDRAGEVVWYGSNISSVLDVRQLPNGNLFVPLSVSFAEVNLLGETVRNLAPPAGLPVNIHDGVPTDHGTILYLTDASRVVTNFPSSSTNPSAPPRTTNVWHQPAVEISAETGALLNSWSLIDMLDPLRIDYLTFTIRTSRGWDWEHANAVIEDPRDDSIMVSMRHQDAVVKFSRATGQLKWILGTHANWGPQFQPYLLQPVSSQFQWNYAQHAPMITPQGTLLLFDNGNFRASPFDPPVADTNNHSRAVEFAINEERMEVSQVWEYGGTAAEQFFSGSVGDADYLPQRGNVLVTFGNISYVNGVRPNPIARNAAMVRIQEVTHEPVPEVVFDLALFDYSNNSSTYRGYLVYRSDRIADLYAVVTPAQAVKGLLAAVGEGAAVHGQSLNANLLAALASIDRGNAGSAANQLQAFQNKVLAQVARSDPGLATQLIYQAQGIIDALNEGGVANSMP